MSVSDRHQDALDQVSRTLEHTLCAIKVEDRPDEQ